MKRRMLCAALLALLLLALCPAALADSWADEGNYDISWYSDTETVFHISTEKQLAGLMSLLPTYGEKTQNQTFYLDNDLDMAAHEWFCQTAWPFMGTFDGLGHTISNLKMNGTYNFMGLFYWLQGATVQNLNINHANLTTNAGRCYSGLLAAVANNNTLIRNCTTSGEISVNKPEIGEPCYVGGLVGYAGGLTVQGCSSDATLKCKSIPKSANSKDYMGGIVGYKDHNGNITVQDCLFTGQIEDNDNDSGAVIGGMVGEVFIKTGSVSNCLMLGTLKGTAGGYDEIYFYRFALMYSSPITNCYYVEQPDEVSVKNQGARCVGDVIQTKAFLTDLNANTSSGVEWKQGTDGTPVPGFRLADYTSVDAAISEAMALNRGDYLDFGDVDAAVNAVVKDLRIFDQDKVDTMAQAIEAALAALVPRPLDLPHTGDASNLPLWAALALCSLLALAALTRRSGALR